MDTNFIMVCNKIACIEDYMNITIKPLFGLKTDYPTGGQAEPVEMDCMCDTIYGCGLICECKGTLPDALDCN